MRRGAVPSTGLLRYLRTAIGENRRRCYCSGGNGAIVAPPAPAQAMRNQDVIGERSTTMTMTTTTTTTSDAAKTSTKRTPVTRREQYQRRLKDLARRNQWNELRKSVEYGTSVGGLKVSSLAAKKLVYHCVSNQQYLLALDIFRDWVEPSGSKHSKTIVMAIQAASKAYQHSECERIYSKYLDCDFEYPMQAHHALLQSYLQAYDLNTARELLHSWDKDGTATDETLQLFMVGVSRIVNNVNELVQEFEKWTSHRKVGAAAYATFLEQLLLFDISKYEQIVDSIHAKFKNSSELEHVYIQHAIMTRNEKQMVKHINALGIRRHILNRRPFLLAMRYFANLGDIESLGFATGAFSKSGFQMDTQATNLISLGLYKQDNLFDLAGYIESGAPVDSNTVKFISKALVDRSPNKNIAAAKLGYKDDSFVDTTVRAIKKLAKEGNSERAVAYLKDFKQRGISPPRQVYMTLLRALIADNHSNRVGEVCNMMAHDGYEPDASLELLLLRKDFCLQSHEQVLMRLITFLQNNPPHQLSLHDRSSVAYELICRKQFDKATFVLDGHRQGGEPITSRNHDSFTLQLLIHCYRKQNDLLTAIDMINLMLECAAQPTIALQSRFFAELDQCFVSAVNSGEIELSMQMWGLKAQCNEYRQTMIEQTERDVHKVQAVLKSFDS